MDPRLGIGDLAARCGVATHVLRHWEDVGLLSPAARVSGRRRYDESHVARVVMIQRGKAAGMSLEQLGRMFDASGVAERRAVLAEQHAKLDERIRAAQESKRLVDHALSCEAPDFVECPHFQRLVAELSVSSRTG
ncbi:transcriptional regulator, MerR family [Kribbella flavida DSM 17836]|uniref:Transcriptional regulator, MerR family n=1 Tax=Kribbella flavida (strain DSM 17836 / JCM 10339 / NBRC 14399) TaxID=479435 RepID=D2PWG0_KRIFD|nr:MerR family transcriptional regulator [Kribbella flavida]ADB31612.1 transcriptional regulator, MerR family [Kribbella flavida DSM 17836]